MASSTAAGQPPVDTDRTSVGSWYMLLVLTVLLALGLVDRLSLSLLVEPVKHDLGINDGQMSLLIGASFALLYTAVGLPAGYLVDRFSRRYLILAGGLLWTMMTFASAFAPSFGWLFLTRAGVGLGEAVLSPAIYSMIRDEFSPARRPLAYGLNNLGSPLGTGIALILIGWLSGLFAEGAMSSVAIIGHLGSWRGVLAVIGLAGIPVTLLMLTVREPKRPEKEGTGAENETSVAAVWERFRAIMPVYLGLFGSTAFYGVGLNGFLAWAPTAMIRAFGATAAKIGPTLGLIQMAAAPLGLLLAGGVLTLLARRGRLTWAPYIGGGALIGCAAALAAWSRAPGLEQGWSALAAMLFLTPWCGVTVATLLAQVTPSRMMGKIAAVNFLMLGLVGMIGGPTINPFLASHFFVGPHAMTHGVALGSGLGFLGAGLCLFATAVAIRRTDPGLIVLPKPLER